MAATVEKLAPANIAPLARGQKVGTDLAMFGGLVMPRDYGELMSYAQMMCKSDELRPWFRDNPANCMMIIQRALTWDIDPWAVASKTYKGHKDAPISYEAQLIAAVVQKWAPVKEKVWAPIYSGEGENRKCKLTLHHAETNEVMEYESPIIGKPLPKGENAPKTPPVGYVGIFPKNSPLWQTEPDQQLFYYSIRAWARRFQPGILLGVYDREEAMAVMRDITPKERKINNMLEDGPAETSTAEAEVLPPERKDEPKTEFERAAETYDEIESQSGDPEEQAHDDRMTDEGPTEEVEEVPLIIRLERAIDALQTAKACDDYRHNVLAGYDLTAEESKRLRKRLADRAFDLEEL